MPDIGCTLQIWRKCSSLLFTDLFICRGKQRSLISRSDASMSCLSADCGAAEDVGRNASSAMTSPTKNPGVIFNRENCGSSVHFSSLLTFKRRAGPVQARKRPQIRMLSWSSVSRGGGGGEGGGGGGRGESGWQRTTGTQTRLFFFPSRTHQDVSSSSACSSPGPGFKRGGRLRGRCGFGSWVQLAECDQ